MNAVVPVSPKGRGRRSKMVLTAVIAALTCVSMIAGVLFFPKLRLGKFSVSTFWIVTLIGACILLATGAADISAVADALAADTAVNPLKILALFLSMTVLSVFLDELGFFRYFANAALRRAGTSQKRLFFLLYAVVSLLTVFTSNDVIILSFTPFILYFSKRAGIDPIPYLVAEFVAANTWSMALIIGNPTNIYLAGAFGVDFVTYLEYSVLPTVCAGGVGLLVLWLLFRKKLSAPIEGRAEDVVLEDKLQLGAGIVHLGACTLLLAVGPYFGLEMWIVAVCAVGSLFLFSLAVSAFRRRKPAALLGCLRRAPYELVPFVLSMFVMVIALDAQGITDMVASFFGESGHIVKYGVSSFLVSNLVNNIPMSVLFSSVLESVHSLPAVLATVVGSNLGALFTPIGALAGIMWSSILARHGVKYGYGKFILYGAAVSLPALFAALGVLMLVTL